MKHRWHLRAQEPLPEPAGISLDIKGILSMTDVQLIVLVGLPGESSSSMQLYDASRIACIAPPWPDDCKVPPKIARRKEGCASDCT